MLSICLTLVTLLTLASARCPERCSCGVGDELEYSCQVGGATITITTRLMDYGNIDCEGGALSCSDLPSIPIAGNRTLPSLSIRDCSLPDPLSCIARRLDASGVKVVTLNNPLTPLEKRHVEGLGSGLSDLIIFNAEAQTSVPSEALSSLPSLQHFRLRGGDVTLTGTDFLNSPPLTHLELAADHISSLPAGSFQGLGQLKVLNFWGNNVTDVSEDAFRGLSSLEDLYISTSHVRALPPRLLSHTPALKTLSLVRNLVSTLHNDLFKDLPHLKQVSISNDVPLTIEPLAFSNLTLTSLTLTRAGVSTLPPRMLDLTTGLVNLTITYNNISYIPHEIFEGLTSLEKLDLSHNRILNISNTVFLGLKALKELKMDGNLIEELPGQMFSGLRHLESLSISSNRLHSLHPDTFQGVSLLHVSLSHNSLSLSPPVTPFYYGLQHYSPFNNLLKVRTLDLSGNLISTMFDDWRNVLLDLRMLDLKYNNFEELNEADVQFLSSEVVVDLRHNNITTVLLSPDPGDPSDPGDTYTTRASVLLAHNPLACDCWLYTLATRLRGKRPPTEPTFDLNETYCASPPQLYGLKVPQVALTDFICDVNCSCQCQILPYIDSLNVDCLNDSIIPDPREYGLSYSMVKLGESPRNLTVLPDYVTVLNLSGIGLGKSPQFVPKTLEILDLTNNDLEEFPVALLNGNLSLKLSGNAFLCECSAVNEISIMNKFNKKIIDWEHVKCKDGALLWRIEVEKLCLVQHAAVLGGLLATCGVLLAAAAMLIHRYSIEIRIFLTNRGLLCGVDEYDATKKYDVFVSFAHTDETFVIDKLLPKLESNYKVCVHHRDWRVGDLIPAQIARSVEESRRTLIVLSRNFLASTWGMLEFRAAHVQAAKDKKVRVIVLLLEDLSNIDIDRELRAYLTTNTYIQWGDPWFWERMQYALPRRPRAEEVRSERRAKEAADSMARGGLRVTLTADGKLVNNVQKHI